ncbi:MAG: ester cyclase [Thermoplasmata archaeon]|nr:MAG: ester cyclase [Thermoplasmata archaeon]
MPEEENKTIAYQFFKKVWNQGNMDAMQELMINDIKVHTGSQNFMGIDRYKDYILAYRKAFPDVKFTFEDQIAEGDKVVDFFTIREAYKGELQGIPPTDRSFEIKGIAIIQIKNNKMVEIWGVFDALGMMRQIGAVPPAKQ